MVTARPSDFDSSRRHIAFVLKLVLSLVEKNHLQQQQQQQQSFSSSSSSGKNTNSIIIILVILIISRSSFPARSPQEFHARKTRTGRIDRLWELKTCSHHYITIRTAIITHHHHHHHQYPQAREERSSPGNLKPETITSSIRIFITSYQHHRHHQQPQARQAKKE